MTTEPTTVADELGALRRIVAVLDKLDRATQDRVVAWLFDRYHEPIEDELDRLERTA